MHTRSILLCLGLAWIASAAPAPLNINLGAYSPALVVGDGAISFEGAAEGAAAAAPATGAEGGAATEAPAAPATEATTQQQQQQSALSSQADTSSLQGMGKQRLPRE